MKLSRGTLWILRLTNGADHTDTVGPRLDNRCGIFDCDAADAYNWNVDALAADRFDERYTLYSPRILFVSVG